MPESTGDGKIKKEKVVAPPTKVVIRHLPPSLTKEEFLDVVSPLPAHNWLEFYDSEKSLTGHDFRRAYLNFTEVEEIHSFRDQYDGYVFVDQKGNESQAIVEFAPFQKLSRRDQSPKRKDPRMATIQDDPDYLEFIHKLENPETVQLPGTEKMLEEIEAHERNLRENHGVPTTRTPLVEYLEQRRADALLHKMEARSLYDYGGRQGEKMRRRDERKEMKRLQRLERRKVKLEKETAGRRNLEVAEDEYYDEEDDDYEHMDDEEEGEYPHKSGYSKTRPAPVGSKWAKRKEVPSILAKRARRTERRRKEREERAQLEEQQHKRPSSSRLTTSTYDSPGKERGTIRRSKDDDGDHYHEKDAAGDDEWEKRTPKRGAYEGTSGSKRQAGERSGELAERTRHQEKEELHRQSGAAEETKGKRYSVLKRKLEEKKQGSASSTPRSETRRADVDGDTKDTNERSTNYKSLNRSGNSRLSSSDAGTENEKSELGTSKDSFSKSDVSSSKSYDESDTKFGKQNISSAEESGSLISEENCPRFDDSLISEKSDSKSAADRVGDLSSINKEEKMVIECDDDALKSEKERQEEDAEDERERDQSVERITRTMKPSEDERKDTDGGSDAASLKDENTSPRTTEGGTKERTGSDPRTERKIRNKDRPAMQLYRPGQARLAIRLNKDPGGGRTGDGAISAGSGSVGSGGGRSSSSSTPSPEVPVEDEKEGRVEAEEPDAARVKAMGRGRSASGKDSPVLTGANRVRLAKDVEQPRRKSDRSSDYVSERKPSGKASGEKKYRDNYYEEDDGKVLKNLSAKGDTHSKTRKFSKSNEYESKYTKSSINNRGKTNDYESGTVYSKSGSSQFPKSRYDTQQHPVKTTGSQSFRGKFEREDHQAASSRVDSSKEGSVLEDPDVGTEASAGGKEAKPQGKRYSRMRAADGGIKSTPLINKGKEVVVITAEDHMDGDSPR